MVLIGAVLLFGLYLARNPLKATLVPLILGITIAYLLNPLVEFLIGRGFSRLTAIILIYLSLALGILIVLICIIPIVFKELSKLIDMIPYYTLYIQSFIAGIKKDNVITLLPQGVKDILDENIRYLEKVLLNSLERVLQMTISIFSNAFSLVLAPILGFYLLRDKDVIKKNIYSLIPNSIKPKILSVLKDIDETLGRYIKGQIIVSSVVAVMTTIGLILIQIDYAIVIGIMAGMANIIPYFGPIIGAIPAIAIAALKSPTLIIWVIIVFIIVQQIDSTIISPKIIGTNIGLHPVIVIISLIFGGELFGLVGMLLAIPIVAVFKVMFRHLVLIILGVDKK